MARGCDCVDMFATAGMVPSTRSCEIVDGLLPNEQAGRCVFELTDEKIGSFLSLPRGVA
ncbi:hypothetical protein BXY66_3043 [Shimia isoporae]|uniref:Uncharacterized protein n=1 Tax=Shimia isoporae TaxID=647720 RepID=A0A4R1N9E0_9RHOB|nr:hypothetical protein BXY66_3043 [Shimia isoporae]